MAEEDCFQQAVDFFQQAVEVDFSQQGAQVGEFSHQEEEQVEDFSHLEEEVEEFFHFHLEEAEDWFHSEGQT